MDSPVYKGRSIPHILSIPVCQTWLIAFSKDPNLQAMIAKVVISWIVVCALLLNGGALALPTALGQFKSLTSQTPCPSSANLSNQIKPPVKMLCPGPCVVLVELPRPTICRYPSVLSSVDMNRRTTTDPSEWPTCCRSLSRWTQFEAPKSRVCLADINLNQNTIFCELSVGGAPGLLICMQFTGVCVSKACKKGPSPSSLRMSDRCLDKVLAQR